MFKTASVEFFEPTIVKDGQGYPVKSWNYATVWLDAGAWDDSHHWFDTAVVCDVQPATLSEFELRAWGISDVVSNVKKVFMDSSLRSFWAFLHPVNRARVNGTDLYEIRGSNVWPRHAEALWVPVQGVAS
jgi:hypothetical protein